MNKISARIIALLLCASTSAVVFSACAKDDGPKKTVDPTVTKENNTKEPTFEETSEYEGQKFTILQAHDGSNKAENFHDTYIACEERTGEPINDAVIDRNEKVFEKYGVTIEKRQGGAGDAATAAKSGTVDFADGLRLGYSVRPPTQWTATTTTSSRYRTSILLRAIGHRVLRKP